MTSKKKSWLRSLFTRFRRRHGHRPSFKRRFLLSQILEQRQLMAMDVIADQFSDVTATINGGATHEISTNLIRGSDATLTGTPSTIEGILGNNAGSQADVDIYSISYASDLRAQVVSTVFSTSAGYLFVLDGQGNIIQHGSNVSVLSTNAAFIAITTLDNIGFDPREANSSVDLPPLTESM